MAYDGTLPAGGPGNFVSPNTAHEADGVEVDFITVDYINAMNAEVTHPGASANTCLLYTSPSPRDATLSRMPSSA